MLYTRQQLFDKLRELKPMLQREYGIKRIGVFGSYAIDAQDEKSDIDLLVELSTPLGWTYFGLSSRMEELLHTKVDVATPNELKPRIKEQVLKQVVYIE
ncbi:MAG: nucleotidyltransferase family protein [Chitinophagales bacterium]|nr:nucleotidyltransferase family protein [Chitinophagales bacterium]